MNTQNELQRLWQDDAFRKENNAMWIHLVREKRSHFYQIMQAANQAEYLVALIFGPLLLLLGGMAKFPWVQAGYRLLAVTLIILALATWLTQRLRPRDNEHSLRDHIEALIRSYDQRVRFVRAGKVWVSLLMCAGVIAVIMGIPGYLSSAGAWSFTGLVLASFVGAQCVSYFRAKTAILKEREDAVRLLAELRQQASA